jgi:hypothetical protein
MNANARFSGGMGNLPVISIMLFGLMTLGCQPQPSKVVMPVPVPEPLPVEKILDRYNANVAAVPPFMAELREWEVKFRGEEDRTVHHKDSGGNVFYQPPATGESYACCYLTADTLLDNELILGCNQTEYWMYIKRAKMAQWGKYEYLGKPCAETMGLDPQQFLLLAGLRPLQTPDGSPPPALKVLPDKYVIEFFRQEEGRLKIQQEVVIDRRTDLPDAVYLYTPSGRRRIESRLTDFKTFGNATIAAGISLSTPDGDMMFQIQLANLKAGRKASAKLFLRPLKFTGVDNYQQIDKACEGINP